MGTLMAGDELQMRLGEPREPLNKSARGLVQRFPSLVIVDCRFDLADPGAGARIYAKAHLPGARYAHLDHDLSDLSRPNEGRHPLPDAGDFSRAMRRLGISHDSFVVAYDSGSGAFAARLWWLLRVMGHDNVAVLDGGFDLWQREGRPWVSESVECAEGDFVGDYERRLILDSEQVAAELADGNLILLDARATPRFRGEVEPLDRVAGHIPDALNHPFTDNLRDGRFLPQEALATLFASLLDGRQPREVAHMCGSGVTACQNLLAMEYAGFPGSRLFAPSWSGWISDPSRSVAVGCGRPNTSLRG